MAEALVSIALEQLVSITCRHTGKRIRLITGVEKKVEKLQSNLQSIQAVLGDAESRQVKENAVRDWLYKLKDASYDIDDVLNEWNTKIQKLQFKKAENASKPLRKVCHFILHHLSCRPFALRYGIAVKIKSLNSKLKIIGKEKDRFNFCSITQGSRELERPVTTSVVDLTEIHGRDEDKKRIVNLLLSQSNQQQILPITISLVGMGGIGKTTLAQLAFNDDKVNSHFDKKIWVCVSEPFDEIRIAKHILESLTNSASNLSTLEILVQNIRQHIIGKKFLLVLDDVWTENPRNWDQLRRSLKCGSPESRILITTRKESVANAVGCTNVILLGTLPEEKCWSLFSQLAFLGRTSEECENFKEIGRKIVRKCKGLPLAIKTLGGLLRFKRKFGEWQNVLESEIWEIKGVEQELLPPLLLSYYDLPPMLKKCLAYCAIFPKNYSIKKEKLIQLWMSQDYLKVEGNKDMELIGEDYFETLVLRSFFQDFKRDVIGNITSCKMHDIIHDFAEFLTKNECCTTEVDGREFKLESSYKKVRHAMVKIQSEAASFPSFIYTEKSLLRSLVVECQYNTKPNVVYSKLFDQTTCLRSLVLSGCSIEEIPTEIGKLIHLRYLDLFNNPKLTELPEALCGLYNLQTLGIRWCQNLQNLPEGMGNLINLRHLCNWGTSLGCMPKSFERLTSLRTIGEFCISDDSNGRKACSLECLKNFNHLGEIRIKGMGNVTADMVRGVGFNDMKNLRTLGLNFQGRMDEEHQLLLEVLQPPPNLEILWIENYKGSTFPDWIMSLTELRGLGLENCINCEHLPPLGKLSSLEALDIWGLKSVKRVGNEILGMESNAKLSPSPVIAFPKLKYLWFDEMEEWEKWNYDIVKRGEEDMIVMPHLQSLRIWHCRKLRSLPNLLRQMTTLKKLIYECPLLERALEK